MGLEGTRGVGRELAGWEGNERGNRGVGRGLEV